MAAATQELRDIANGVRDLPQGTRNRLHAIAGVIEHLFAEATGKRINPPKPISWTGQPPRQGEKP